MKTRCRLAATTNFIMKPNKMNEEEGSKEKHA
jgi:hypothetical protein